MSWSLNGTVLYVQKLVEGTKQIIASLQPLALGTVYQTFGYETSKVKISALVVGQTALDAIHALTTSGTSVDLTSPEGSLGNYFVSSVSSDREKSVYQTIDLTGGNTCTSPVFNLDIELFKDIP